MYGDLRYDTRHGFFTIGLHLNKKAALLNIRPHFVSFSTLSKSEKCITSTAVVTAFAEKVSQKQRFLRNIIVCRVPSADAVQETHQEMR